jgi:murein DD-endopeptidase MepM/ murein hydrolase activator NlpD
MRPALRAIFSLLPYLALNAWTGLAAPRIGADSDTTQEARSMKRARTNDSAAFEANELIRNHPVFSECWDNTETFPYENVRISDLPERLEIPLLRPGDCFTPTWYGRLNSPYGPRKGRQHHGLDLQLHTGDKVYAAFDGIVRYARYNRAGYGNCIVIRHFNGLETVYAHLSRIEVPVNRIVRSGDPIGRGGNTGRSYGSHLHFEVRFKDYSIDPERLIDVQSLQLRTDTLRLSRSSLFTRRYPDDPQERIDPADSLGMPMPTDPTDLLPEEESPSTAPAAPTRTTERKKKPPTHYTIRKGDHLGSIQRRTGVSAARLRKLNPGLNPRKLMPGRRIRIR